jgi:hypothetical protein
MSAPNYADIMQSRTRTYCCSSPTNGYPSYSQRLNTQKARLNGTCCPYTSIESVTVTGGTNFTVGDLLRLNGGTAFGNESTLLRVTTVSLGAITGVVLISGGDYNVQPNTPYSVTVVRNVDSDASISGATTSIIWSTNTYCPC